MRDHRCEIIPDRVSSDLIALRYLIKHPAFLAAGLLFAAVIWGCGGSDDDDGGFTVRASTTVATGPLDKERFVPHVNRICREAWDSVLENFSKSSSRQSPKLNDEQVFAETVSTSFMAGFDFQIFDEIYRLGGPPGEEEDVEEIIGALQLAVERGQRQVRVSSASQLTALFAEYNRLAREYGLVDCRVDGKRVKAAQSKPEGTRKG